MIFATSNTIYTLHTDTAMVFHWFCRPTMQTKKTEHTT